MHLPEFLATLGLDLSAIERDIRRAYAVRLKAIDQTTQAAQFQQLRSAYEQALQWCRQPEPELAVLPVVEPLPTPPPTPAPVAGQAPAAAVLQTFLQEVRALGARAQAGQSAPLADWHTLLATTLDQPALQDLRARPWFQQQVAQLLALGWQPGHESLFLVAVHQFNWYRDPSVLRAMGPTGGLLDQAIQQWQHFLQTHPHNLSAFETAIARLRQAALPSQFDANFALAALPHLLARYPQWLAMITNTANFGAWCAQGLHFPAPGSHEARADQPRESATPASDAQRRAWPQVGAGLFFFLLLLGGARMLLPSLHEAASTTNTPGTTHALGPAERRNTAAYYRRQRYDEPSPEMAARLDRLIRPKLTYQARAKGNPGVRYQMALSSEGEVRWLERMGTSGDTAFDDAVEQAVRAAAPYPPELQRHLLLTLYMQ